MLRGSGLHARPLLRVHCLNTRVSAHHDFITMACPPSCPHSSYRLPVPPPTPRAATPAIHPLPCRTSLCWISRRLHLTSVAWSSGIVEVYMRREGVYGGLCLYRHMRARLMTFNFVVRHVNILLRCAQVLRALLAYEHFLHMSFQEEGTASQPPRCPYVLVCQPYSNPTLMTYWSNDPPISHRSVNPLALVGTSKEIRPLVISPRPIAPISSGLS